jgi:glycosyltransferase involved in cell wall biosynthesis
MDTAKIVPVSIVIPALNEAKNLARSLPVVLSQAGPQNEIIVVDNGSQDETQAVARSCGVTVIHEPVRGRSPARNAGFTRAGGSIVVFLDADCMPHQRWLDNLLAPFSDETVGCVAGEIAVVQGADDFGRYLLGKGHLSQRVNFAHPFLPFGGSGNVAFRRAVLERIGVFDENLFSGHDADLCWRMQLQTQYKILLSEDALVYHKLDLAPRAVLKQKRRHGHGSVLLYKKYQDYRRGERKPLKRAYWEYRSIIRRACGLLLNSLAARLRRCPLPPSDQQFQLYLEIGEKIGRVEGCLRHRIWFP